MIPENVIRAALLVNIAYCGYQLTQNPNGWEIAGCASSIVFATDALLNRINS